MFTNNLHLPLQRQGAFRITGRLEHHDGIDVTAPPGAPISAIEAGTVTFAGWKPGYGNTVVIRHEDGLESLYAHVSGSLVHIGQTVEARTPIASVGSSGRSTGPHLHFEVRRNGKAFDPTARFGLPQPGSGTPGGPLLALLGDTAL